MMLQALLRKAKVPKQETPMPEPQHTFPPPELLEHVIHLPMEQALPSILEEQYL